jgi:hypothetical protein
LCNGLGFAATKMNNLEIYLTLWVSTWNFLLNWYYGVIVLLWDIPIDIVYCSGATKPKVK